MRSLLMERRRLRQLQRHISIHMRVGRGADKLIELDLYGTRVAVLTVLNDEDHQEGDDGCASVDG